MDFTSFDLKFGRGRLELTSFFSVISLYLVLFKLKATKKSAFFSGESYLERVQSICIRLSVVSLPLVLIQNRLIRAGAANFIDRDVFDLVYD